MNFERVLELSPEEPQSYRDLGLAYAADHQFQKAVDLLYEVVLRPWHGRFQEIELIALADLNAVAAGAARAGKSVQVNFYGHRQQIVAGATTLQVKFITGFGTAQREERLVPLRLRDRQEVVTVGKFEVGSPQQ